MGQIQKIVVYHESCIIEAYYRCTKVSIFFPNHHRSITAIQYSLKMTNALIISCCCLSYTFNPLSFYEAYLLYSTLPHEAYLPHSILLYLMLLISYCTYPEPDPLCSSDCLSPFLFPMPFISYTYISVY